MRKLTYTIKTFGCQMNTADSEEMGRHLNARGFNAVDDIASADAILINTCTIRDLAEHKAASLIGSLREWKAEKPGRMVIVTGCAAERAKQEWKKKFSHIDLIVGAKDIERFPEEIDQLLKSTKYEVGSTNKSDRTSSIVLRTSPLEEELIPPSLDADVPTRVSQHVTVMRGCNYNCTYCIVPSVRGKETYRPVSDILEDVKIRVQDGAKEIWLLGQTVNSYRAPDTARSDYEFADLLEEVSKIPGAERLRFMSPHPYYITPKLVEVMANNQKICDHIHLPVQSGSDEILKKMKRNYTRESFLDSVRALRKASPAISITTDIIVGFPGETLQDFELTKSLVLEAGFDSAYCFKYSERPGTASAEWPDDVPELEKERRVNEMLALTDGQGMEKAKALIGTIQEILLEVDKGGNLFRGKTRGAWHVRLRHPSLQVGQIVRVKITGTHSRELHAELK